MKQAIRVLGLGTLFLAIFFTAFVVSVVYSALNYRMSFGEPTFFSDGDVMGISIPIMINNTGFHDISNLNFTTIIQISEGRIIAAANTFVPTILHRQNIIVRHNVTLDVNELVSGDSKLLFEDEDFVLEQFFSLNFGRVIPLSVFADETLLWGAPFYNFSVGEIGYPSSPSDPRRALIPISFDNHSSLFNTTGTLRIELYNEWGEFFGEGTSVFDVAMGTHYESAVEVFGTPSFFTRRGQLHVYFDTDMFSYGPLVIEYGD